MSFMIIHQCSFDIMLSFDLILCDNLTSQQFLAAGAVSGARSNKRAGSFEGEQVRREIIYNLFKINSNAQSTSNPGVTI